MDKNNIIDHLISIRESGNIENSREMANSILREMEGESESSDHYYIISDLRKIVESQSQERASHYASRAIKSLTEVRKGKINDIDLNRWREYDHIITDSLWIMEKRERSGSHNAEYWGNFIPQIPAQMIERYTRKGEWVLDTFLGGGTTLIECRRKGRNGVGIELSKRAVEMAENNIKKQENPAGVITEIIQGDSTKIDYEELMEKIGIKEFQIAFIHPPYWDIIRFSEEEGDLSNAPALEDFLSKIRIVGEKVFRVLQKGRMAILVIGDKYDNGQIIPLGFYSMKEMLDCGFSLKSIIVKNFEKTKGKNNQEELWRYRALVGNFFVFKHEYIFVFEKKLKGRNYKKSQK
ncbi:TRM11 family SAM-dependent methyltransferase [Cuniculiplasma sp. SKW3]|uniref:TRM11 family SAM-dependent methyltransferase n=1 Tax=Cuniculiplasma sp. SKW3 TaxID=3400170 RepID=UPI003FD2791B